MKNNESIPKWFVERIKKKEGFASRAYYDTTGHLTIGYGYLLEGKLRDIHLYEAFKLGYFECTEEAAEFLLITSLRRTIRQLNTSFPFAVPWRRDNMRSGRYWALVEMAYNLGIGGVLGFRSMLQALRNEEWEKARDEALDSLWAKQVGRRAQEVANAFVSGKLPGQRDTGVDMEMDMEMDMV